ncbi:MAG: lysylphosphatidylglycerol synthase transmembrane domain-containing protein [Candidatus Dormibacterales bacterium]
MISVVSLLALVLVVNPVSLVGVFRRVRPVPLLLMFPVTVLIYVLRALGWGVTLRRIGIHISLWRTISVMFAGKTLVFLPVGDLGRVAYIEELGAEGHDAGEVTGTIAFQELLYMTIMGLAIVPAAVSHPDIGVLAVGLTVVQVSVFGVLLWGSAYEWALSTVERVRLLRRFHPQLKHVRPAFLHLFHPPTAAAVVVWNACAVVAAFFLFELALMAVGVHGITFVQAAFIYALGHILAALSFLPGGVGAYEGILTAFMALHGVPPSQGAAAALLYRAFNDILMAVVGLGAAGLLRHWAAAAARAPRRSRRKKPAA